MTERPKRAPRTLVQRAGRPHSGFDIEQMRELHEQGLCDAHIAHAMGRDPKTVRMYRRKLGLPANLYDKRSNNGPKGWNADDARRLYDDGCTDMVIARTLGIGLTTVHKWRTSLNLPAIQGGNLDDRRVRELYDGGSSDSMLAEAFGVSRTAIQHWRKQNGLPPNLERQHLDEGAARQLYNDGCNDTLIAQRLGVHRDVVLRWRQREHLPSVRNCLDQEQALTMWSEGATDRMIADALDCTVSTVRQWRYRNNMPVNPAGK